MKGTISFRLTILSVLTLLVGLSVGLVLGLQSYFGVGMGKSMVDDSFRRASSGVQREFMDLKKHSRATVGTVGFIEALRIPPAADEFPALGLLTHQLEQNTNYYAVYCGYATGDFYELINLESGAGVRKIQGALPQDRWVVIKILETDNGREKQTSFVGRDLAIRATKTTPTSYDPRTRPWYRQAQKSVSVIETKPYAFSNLEAQGVTFAKARDKGQRVVALDISLQGMTTFMEQQDLLAGSQAYVFENNGVVLVQAQGPMTPGSSRAASLQLPEELLQLSRKGDSTGVLHELTLEGKTYLGLVERMSIAGKEHGYLGFLVPLKIMMQPYMEKLYYSLLVTLGMTLLLSPLVMYLSSLLISPIRSLSIESDKVKRRQYQDVRKVQSKVTEIHSLSVSIFTMAESIRQFEQAQRDLMDSFIKLIALAIDRKSPYTGGHCERVPEIAGMLARKASASDAEALADFKLDTEEEWYEFMTAAWLHDCGKVTTPEYIVDKATKLEAIYNRIHEVRMRFEVLRRDAEIAYLRSQLESGPNGLNEQDKAVLKQKFEDQCARLQEDFAFVAECNVGGEFMEDARIERLHKIAARTWVRYFDDRLGLSHVERERLKDVPSEVPCIEHLLADRPDHIIERPRKGLEEMKEGFNMEIPEYLYNLGEVYNLSIKRGTLTAEDRFKINEHMIATLQMLETMPYPDHLKKIPEYAGSHHETLIGTGYPRKLSARDIGIPGRIMTIADIFEALTASDRPYKEAKTLTQSLKIMSFMVKDQHIDADLFRLFLESGVYVEYAHKFLQPEQIDDVNIEDYLQ